MLIKVKVFPNSKKQKIVRKFNDSFEISVKAKPIKGLANKEVIDVLCSYFKISFSKIRLVRGPKQRNKIFEIIM